MFKTLSTAVAAQIQAMKKGDWFEVDIPKDVLWSTYLNSFPEGTNPLYKERTEHDCNCCRHFIRDVGALISVHDGKVSTVWDVKVDNHYQVVADAMAKVVREGHIKNLYTHISQVVGAETTLQQLEDGRVKKWFHFYGSIPKEKVKISPTVLSDVASTVAVFKRGIEEITDDAVDATLELIDQNSLYRGQEFKEGIVSFRKLKKSYVSLTSPNDKDLFLWSNHKTHGARIRNTVIGTMLQDLSEGYDLDDVVKAFESKVAPTNYKRPAPVITKRMVEDALKAVRQDGLEDALKRRFAVVEDVSVNDILYVDRGVRSAMRDSLADSLMSEVKDNVQPKDFSKTKEVPIEEFITKVLPQAQSLEVLVENAHEPNLVSLVSPVHKDARGLFKWDNGFSWSYKGNVTDSIKERVKAAGGRVDGYMRVSLSWFNFDDLDLHVFEPGAQKTSARTVRDGEHICFSHRLSSRTGGQLDVDMNAGSGSSRTPVENIVWAQQAKMLKGNYAVVVNNFCRRESTGVGFEVEVECAGEVYKFKYDKPVRDKQDVPVAALTFDGMRITEAKAAPNIEMGSAPRNFWGVDTQRFHKVSLVTLSPNHWHGSSEGNKHYIFVLEGCKNPEAARGFYNEFLPAKYNKYRKVLEVLGDKTKCEVTDKQLSGLGFSSTKENSIVCKVSSKDVSRMIKVVF